jgi:integrase
MSVQKRVTTRADGSKHTAFRMRYEDADGWQSKTFKRKSDADLFDAEVTRRRRLGSLAALDAGSEPLDTYVTDTWAPMNMPILAPKTRSLYTMLYDVHICSALGTVPLRELTPEMIGRWQSDRLNSGAGPVAVYKALTLLGGILQRAAESGRLPAGNPARLVRRAPLPHRAEVRPLAPVTVEAMRLGANPRDATLISVLAYAGLRPGEALALHWGDIRENTILVERAVSLGKEKDTKTTAHRTVRLLAPLAADLREWRMRSGRPADSALVFPSQGGSPWSQSAYQSWRRKAFRRALTAAGVEHARPYDLRHSFASLLLHQGKSVIYVARQLGHDATLTTSIYGHVIDELEDSPQQDAEAMILAARSTGAAHELPIAAV